jgi:hypothetical protein
MTSKQLNFDLVIVIGYFRSALPLLSVVRYLSPWLRIGLYFQPLNPQMEAKTGDAQKMFERLCIRAGGVSCAPGSQVKCRLMLVQQYPYTDGFMASILSNIEAKEIFGVLSLASMGIDVHDAFIKQFGVNHLIVPDKALANFLIDARNASLRYQDMEMTEVGLPFQNHPVFEGFAVDWVIAAPTLFSFHTEADKQSFLRNVLKLIEQIAESDVIAYKHHNGNQKDYFTPRLHVKIANLISWAPAAETLLEYFMLLPLPRRILSHIDKVLTAILHARVKRRAVAMNQLTPMADMSLEAFLPGIRKGVIGGLSNTIWGCLYFDKHYYNCVDESNRCGRSELLNKSSDNLLDLNLKYFGVPFCKGDLTTDVKNFSIAQIKERAIDLVEFIELRFNQVKT